MTEEVVRTKRLEVVDDEGHVRIVAEVGERGDALLEIADPSQVPRASLSVEQDGMAALSLNDEAGRRLITLAIRPDSLGLLVREPAPDSEPTVRISLQARADGTRASLNLNDAKGEPRAIMMVVRDGRSMFFVVDEDGDIHQEMEQE